MIEADTPLSPFAQASRDVNIAVMKHWALAQKIEHIRKGYAEPWKVPEYNALMAELDKAFDVALEAIQKRETLFPRENERFNRDRPKRR